MPLNPPVAEDLLALLDKYPDLTPVQKAIRQISRRLPGGRYAGAHR